MTRDPPETFASYRETDARGAAVTAWITRVPDDEVERAVARALAAGGRLAGWRLGVKDNIDVAGLPTTAAHPQYARTSSVSATVVDRLVAAGAVVTGKTNLDQFATGL